MKKILQKLLYSAALLSSENTFAADCSFDIENASDLIIGKLWKGDIVPSKNITELFELIDETKEAKNHHLKGIDINSYINCWKNAVLDNVSSEDDQRVCRAINQFATEVGILYSTKKFSPTTVKNSLNLILEKY